MQDSPTKKSLISSSLVYWLALFSVACTILVIISGHRSSTSLSVNHSDYTSLENQVRVSNSSDLGVLSNSSVELLDKKDGLSNNSATVDTSNQVRVSNGSVNSVHLGGNNGSMNRTQSAVEAVDKGKMVISSASGDTMVDRRKEEDLSGCDFFDGNWVKDDSYPLYKPGSCPFIDEAFNCYQNGRPDSGYEKFRWQPKGCNIPRMNASDMLRMLRGKRMVFVGDSLNRNMWESMVCTLSNAVEDKTRVFEVSGRSQFRTEGAYSFVFKDYNCSVEFFRSIYFVRQWEMPDANGVKRETLRLDVLDRSFQIFKTADILVFNTAHWWTHEKTSQGKDFYQVRHRVYPELSVTEAFRKAMTTWGRWVDANINTTKTLVFFRGYSSSHFGGGRWNSGGQCDNETTPFEKETYVSGYLPIMTMFETVRRRMKTPVVYLNVTKMTDFRRDAHPSIWRTQNMTEEKRRSPSRPQDCSHWCLPGVPEAWNEIIYAHMSTKYKQKQLQKGKE